MNKISTSIFVIILFSFVENNFAQSYTTIKTPTNTIVEAIIFPEFSSAILAQIEADAANWILDNGLNAVRVAPASGIYNCHNFAWHYSDGGASRWINQHDRYEDDNISKYWSGSTPTYQPTTSSKASKVFYSNGDHSAITISTGIYESKWGSWPRYRHSLNDCPYNTSGIQYYNIPISGSDVICGNDTEVYSTVNISGATYLWDGNKINILGSGFSVNASENGYGSGWINTEITSPYSGTTVKSNKKYISVGLTASFGGTSYILYLETGTYTATSDCATNYEWWYRKGGTGIEPILIASGNPLVLKSIKAGSEPPLPLSLQQQAEQQLIEDDGPIINQPITQTEFFLYVRAFDAYGNEYTTPEQRFTAGGNVDLIPDFMPFKSAQTAELSEEETTKSSNAEFTVYPNPAEKKLNIQWNAYDTTSKTNEYEATLFDINSKQVKQIKSTGIKTTMNVEDVNPGIYFLQLRNKNKILSKKVVIK